MPALSPRRPADASCAPRRLFFALTLPPALCRQLVAWRAARFPAETGRPVAQANLHLTLAFLGNVGAAQEQALRDRAARNGCYQNSLPFHPHISLWRQATRPVALPPDTPGWTTRVSRFGLWLSAFDNGRVRYRLVQDWPLRRDGPQ
ncbi:2'-5' RNA ligase family protein [Sodalis sp. (in: enterobacteria)]|uniref:2'-5' RNA ligase family protein n=1 Tax=Sodalis sp. (in: enterobacteria) TaxID=1898979 RepID=UPI003F3D8B0A